MKRILLSLAIICGITGPALADTVSIAVGQEGRGYERAGKELQTRLNGRIETEIVNYTGSDDISRALCDGTAFVGIAQIDALFARSNEGCKLRVVGTYGHEYAYLMVPPGSPIADLGDINETTKILVDEVGSGTDLFWHTIVSIETGPHGNKSRWHKAKAVNDFSFLADPMAASGEIDAALFVTTPNSNELKELYDLGWRMAKIKDKDIDDQQYNGASLYAREKAEIKGTGGFLRGSEDNSTYVIPSFFIVGPDAAADRRTFADIARAVKTISAK